MIGIKPEFDIVHPESELKMLTTVIRSTTLAIAEAEKELVDLAAAPKHALEIVLKDAEGAVVPIEGADGKLYDSIQYDDVEGKNVKSLMTQAGIGLARGLPDAGNLRLRIGGRRDALKKQLQDYLKRQVGVWVDIEAMASREDPWAKRMMEGRKV